MITYGYSFNYTEDFYCCCCDSVKELFEEILYNFETIKNQDEKNIYIAKCFSHQWVDMNVDMFTFFERKQDYTEEDLKILQIDYDKFNYLNKLVAFTIKKWLLSKYNIQNEVGLIEWVKCFNIEDFTIQVKNDFSDSINKEKEMIRCLDEEYQDFLHLYLYKNEEHELDFTLDSKDIKSLILQTVENIESYYNIDEYEWYLSSLNQEDLTDLAEEVDKIVKYWYIKFK